jgi:hypothetical protein
MSWTYNVGGRIKNAYKILIKCTAVHNGRRHWSSKEHNLAKATAIRPGCS